MPGVVAVEGEANEAAAGVYLRSQLYMDYQVIIIGQAALAFGGILRQNIERFVFTEVVNEVRYDELRRVETDVFKVASAVGINEKVALD